MNEEKELRRGREKRMELIIPIIYYTIIALTVTLMSIFWITPAVKEGNIPQSVISIIVTLIFFLFLAGMLILKFVERVFPRVKEKL